MTLEEVIAEGVEAPKMLCLNYRYRLLPTRGQHRRLREALEHSRQLYNAALEERIDCYRKTGRGLGYIDQCRGLTALRPIFIAHPRQRINESLRTDREQA